MCNITKIAEGENIPMTAWSVCEKTYDACEKIASHNICTESDPHFFSEILNNVPAGDPTINIFALKEQ